ncbi:hypothetical protein CAEBREN_20319 [Caenorhabditis brenneri]|uniref:Uncharacterized protein n=1 Tax=Caenorhabditis brenneri TaxID=135651 RepID=G0N3A4_CAEBE|nr:hypothetical protein CAEBREN_20319 [Caenorhabditis brenneri]
MLPKNEKEALFDVDDRIHMLERRLDNAKAARDAFVQHLRGKYPDWTPPLPTMSYQEANFPSISATQPVFQPREPLVSRLSTGDYQWDVDNNQGLKDRMNIRSRPLYRAAYANAPTDIPTSGPLLESDIRRSRIRLREISEELRSMRIDRMNLSTEQWLREQHMRQHKSLPLHFGPFNPEHDHPKVDHLDQAIADLSRIDLTETMPVDTPTTERKVDLEMREAFEKQLAERRAEPEVRFQEPVVAQVPVVQAPVVQAPVVQAPVVPAPVVPAPVAQAPAVPAPVVEAPPPVAPPPSNTNTISNLLSQITGKSGKISSDEDDSPRFQGFPSTKPASSGLDYSKLLGGMNSNINFSDDEDDDVQIPTRPIASKTAKKSAMFGDDDDDNFW